MHTYILVFTNSQKQVNYRALILKKSFVNGHTMSGALGWVTLWRAFEGQ